ncbi:hypothetical protein CLV43_114291 [Umezawaea tangerina]|uniref:Uncharacterized protein n=1 Tax=Umezawaea tangerina TaxID=84725 RepID=A0A2T0SPT7_9PSEU|nr:hypothetical protein CLV43_114291 [Umezawaea tangerina]
MKTVAVVAKPEAQVAEVSVCRQCTHEIRRAAAPWDNEFRCAEGCRCLMVGCVPAAPSRPT